MELHHLGLTYTTEQTFHIEFIIQEVEIISKCKFNRSNRKNKEMHIFCKTIVTMYIFILKSAIKVIGKQPTHVCSLVSDDQKLCFIKDLLLSAEHNGNQVAVDKITNTLYFSFDAGQGEFNPAMLNIDTKKLKLLKGVKDAYAIASNDNTGEMYFGGSNGIYKYIPVERKLLRLNFRDLDVWWLFIQKEICYIQFPKLTAYMYARKIIRPIKKIENSVVHQFVLDSQKSIFFINTTGIFRVKSIEDRPVMLRNTPTFLGLAVDNKGKVHMCSDDGIYVMDSDSGTTVKRLVAVKGVLALAFDKNNHLIYSDSHDLVRLLPMLKREVKVSTMKRKADEFRSVYVCQKTCEVLKMRNH